MYFSTKSVLKNENVTVPDLKKLGYRWYRGPGQPGSWRVGPYDFRDAEKQKSIQIWILHILRFSVWIN